MRDLNNHMVPDDFIYPDDVHSALRERKDIFRVIGPENPLLRACELMYQIGNLVAAYNDLVKGEIRSCGFNQFPEVDFVAGRDIGENGRGSPSGFYNLDLALVLSACREAPQPLHSYFLREQRERKEAAARQDAVRKKKAKITASIVERLGYTPSHWICVYCSNPGTPEKGPDGRVWHVDHRYPKVLGGDNKSDNLVLSCATCNMSKGAKSAREFELTKGANA